MSISPSDIARSVEPQSGQLVGISNARSLPLRFSMTGPRISGITSPAFRKITTSPIKIPLRVTSWAL
ncbi:unannotated protein [freshwater metagenome]|uniref:Unannotated protein n=1 Tax=freshwater metagenome TaxID=449393 RepID=A0A6J6YIW3_9ZZZZ